MESTPTGETENLKDESLENLKLRLQEKLKKVKSGLKSLNLKLSEKLKSQSEEIKTKHSNYITDLKNKSISYIQSKDKKIKNKEVINHVYFEAIRKVKRIERFEKNMSDIILDSLKNYNNLITNKLPYYKNSSHQFLKNHEDKLCNNNIYSKLTKKQIDKIYHNLEGKNLIYFINGKYPVDLKILITENCIENSLILSSTKMNKLNSAEIDKLTDNSFNDFFENVREEKKKMINDIIIKNSELKSSEMFKIPLLYQNLKIIDSKIYSSIFNNMSFKNLVKFNLDNVQIDSFNFDNIFKNVLLGENKNLKEFSVKNNYISRIVLDDELVSKANILVSLEVFNLANNNIYTVDKRILDLMPNLKVLDLTNNSLLHETNCKELIKNCKGIVLLLKNIVILKDSMYNFYMDYYKKFFSNKFNSKFPLDYINFDSFFYKRNNMNIEKFDYSSTKSIENIKELNLSSCSLDNKNVINILSNCVSIKNNLAKINISYNLLNEELLVLLTEDKINALLKNLKELDLSYNLIKFKFQKDGADPKLNQLVIFLENFSQLELLNLKSTPFEETLNEFIKMEIKIYYSKKDIKDKQEVKLTNEIEHRELKSIIENYYLQINQNFHIIINDLITLKYSSSKRMKQILPILEKNLIIDNQKPEVKEAK
jgi:hypothetical protein